MIKGKLCKGVLLFFFLKKNMSGEKLLLDYPAGPPPSSPDQHRVHQLESELRKFGSMLSTFAYVSFVTAMVCMSITAGVFFTSSTLSRDRRAFFLGILGVCFLGLVVVIIISRRQPATLLLFNILLSVLSAFSLGLSISYA